MDESWIAVVALAASPLVVVAAMWGGLAVSSRLARRRMRVAAGAPLFVDGHRRYGTALGSVLVLGTLVVIVGSMSKFAAIGLGIAAAVAKGLVVCRGATASVLRFDHTVERELRSFLDDEA